MEDRHSAKQTSGGGVLFAIMFIVGLVGALVVGWWGFPQLLYSQNQQPIRFSHKVHMETAGMECKQCHTFASSGQYVGLPTTEACGECHADETGGTADSDKEIDKLVKTYVQPNKPIPWLNYQFQPDNVFFAHAAHTGFECKTCHPDVTTMDSPPVQYTDRLSTYSKQTMRMSGCERCHAELGVSNACFVCHK